MLFHTATYFWFLLAVIVGTFVLPRAVTAWFLIVASYIFYGWSGPPFVLLLLATSITDYSLARYFAPRRSKWKVGIAISAAVNFSLLGFFKYSNFALANVKPALAAFGVEMHIPEIDILLPVGISFYTFQSFAYTVDVLTGRIPACRSVRQFFLFVAWFPQLVAGPIMRAGELLPQLNDMRGKAETMAARVPAAVALFAEGWLRKACADLAAPASDAFFRDPASATTMGAVAGIVAFGLQIYGDFSGYSRMAQGSSWLFGVRLMENFNVPYAARGVREFWRRWHISLSTWFRDYVYVPLGGNRKGPVRTYFNLVLTMLLCGLWHGAAWTFILWGAMHAVMLVGERVLEGRVPALPAPLAHVATVVLVFLAWVPFRAPDLAATGAAYAALAHGGWQWPPLALVVALAGLVAIDLYVVRTGRRDYEHVRDEALALRSYGEWKASLLIATCALVWAVGHILGQNRAASFIYFQF
jgi:alginate O-acetyltransferase complex protein AlgI